MSEASTVEGRLADMIEGALYIEVGVRGTVVRVLLSTNDCAVIVAALRDRARWMSSDTSSGERRKRG